MRTGESVVTCRRRLGLGMVWRLSKLTTQSAGIPSPFAVSSSSETNMRRVLVSAATTTDPIRSATGSRVSTKTGRSPPGVAANHTSPRFIGPVRPVRRGTPVRDLGQGSLTLVEGLLLPGRGVVLARQADEMAVKGIPQELGTVHAETLGPALGCGRLLVVDPETKHRHTIRITRMTPHRPLHPGRSALSSGLFQPSVRKGCSASAGAG